ncbi:MAG: DinB family protein [Flavipsychrobacter sp.]
MNLSQHLAKHLKDVHFGGNWTSVNLKDALADVSWQQATTKVQSFNTIATLVNHINYYVAAVSKVLEGEALNAKDALSFEHQAISGPEDWQKLVDKLLADASHFAELIAQIPEAQLWEDFTDAKYGNYYRNIQGIIEHTHYHLGQIVILKKILVN